MAAPETGRFAGSHQESITIAVALVDDDQSRQVANMVEPSLFDPPFDDIVARCQEHRRRHGRPPGKSHIDDVFAHVFDDKSHKLYRQYDTIISKMVQQADAIDTNYVLAEVTKFIHQRRVRYKLAEAVERYQKGGERVVEDIEVFARQLLSIREERRDYGFSLADDRALNFLDRDPNDYCYIGIKELDERGVVPTKRELLAFLSPPNRGKSWFLTHCGKFALLKGWKVLHYTLENSDDMTAQRYFQTLFSGVRHAGTYRYAAFNRDTDPVTLITETLDPAFVIDEQEKSLVFLSTKVREWQARLRNLWIRRHPSGKLSFEDLERDLDDMEKIHHFSPDLVMVDMPQLMRLPRRGAQEDWSSLNELVTNLRGLAVERNKAVVVPQQGNRSSNTAKSVQAQHGSGAFGVFGVADNEITYSQTPSEEERGLARLYTQKVRNDRARMTICISQHYDSGQFCMDSYPMTSQLRDEIKAYVGYRAGEGGEEDDEYEEPRRARQ